MSIVDAESARARGHERQGLLYIDLDVPLAMRVCEWQRALQSDGQVPEWTSVARYQIARALREMGHELDDMPVRYTRKWRSSVDMATWRTRLALVPSVALACYREAERRGIKLREVVMLCLASMPIEAPVLPPRATKQELARMYQRARVARNAELRAARRAGEQLVERKRGTKRVLPSDVALVESLLGKPEPTKDIYLERFLMLCKERAARDAWHRKGGRGAPPPSTVDDHLGRKRGTFNAEKIASRRSGAETQAAKHQRLGGMW
jgi:hypothetical protein